MKFSILISLAVAVTQAMAVPIRGSQGLNTRSDDTTLRKTIVVFKEGLTDSEISSITDWISEEFSIMEKREVGSSALFNSSISKINIDSLQGYIAVLPQILIDGLKSNPLVEFIEEDEEVDVYPDIEVEELFSIAESNTTAAVSASDLVQENAPWGLARISKQQNSAQLNYYYANNGGKGVTAYVVDTGIKTEHAEFEGRASWGLAVATPDDYTDYVGHGSHVAGTIGGKTYGVAKECNLVSVGVLNKNGKGLNSDIITGIQYVVDQHNTKVSNKELGYKGSTMNLSIGGATSSALDLAVNAAVKAGLHVIVAAGNDNKNACSYSPARATDVLTVGATGSDDTKAWFSNYGSCVEILAPGLDILSVGINDYSATKSGTSMATPHVTGLITYLLSFQPGLDSEFSAEKLITPAEMQRKLKLYGTKGAITGFDSDTANIMIYNGAGGDLTSFWAL